jgi:hypothetical protein
LTVSSGCAAQGDRNSRKLFTAAAATTTTTATTTTAAAAATATCNCVVTWQHRQNKEENIHKQKAQKTVQTIQNTVNISKHITETKHTLQNLHICTPITLQNKLKTTTVLVITTTVQDIPKRNSPNTITYPQYTFTLMYMALLSPTLTHFT